MKVEKKHGLKYGEKRGHVHSCGDEGVTSMQRLANCSDGQGFKDQVAS